MGLEAVLLLFRLPLPRLNKNERNAPSSLPLGRTSYVRSAGHGTDSGGAKICPTWRLRGRKGRHNKGVNLKLGKGNPGPINFPLCIGMFRLILVRLKLTFSSLGRSGLRDDEHDFEEDDFWGWFSQDPTECLVLPFLRLSRSESVAHSHSASIQWRYSEHENTHPSRTCEIYRRIKSSLAKSDPRLVHPLRRLKLNTLCQKILDFPKSSATASDM